jgi:hypothetical protein
MMSVLTLWAGAEPGSCDEFVNALNNWRVTATSVEAYLPVADPTIQYRF